ncbi:MAG: aminopeptidase [Solobacterium sp.]|nr:aminopeptidase [Solobacterium sp.]MBQ6355515.1 aminopeptidase [Solobacterium sp.]MBQ6532776.1 aminopeptidase [Solobacterium sp.]
MKTVWEKADAKTISAIMTFGDEYRSFLGRTKTEREFVKEARALAEQQGFKDLAAKKGKLKAGDKVYAVNRNKNLCLFVIGKKPLTDGLNILGAHIDSPRLDLKQHPVYEKDGLVLLDTHYYGGIKKYQWVARPMALHGVVCRTDGTAVEICIGEKADDPVVGISDLLIHLAGEQMKKPASTVVEGEALNVLAGSIPMKDTEKDPVKAYLLDLLKKQYDIEEDDFVSAEIEVVPAEAPRDYGLDRSMVLGYGHDDRVCAYTSMRAILEMKKPERTSCCILVDKEEIGSVGATGMQSRWFESILARLLAMQGSESLVALNDCLTRSKMLSSDVSAAFDPNYPEVNDPKNCAYFGGGIVFNKYTGARGKSGSNDANAEYVAEVRRAMQKGDITFQTSELGAVDVGGGGTIAFILGNLNMDVIDAGIAVHNMHAPSEIVSKADVYEGYRAYRAFLTYMGE